MKKQSRKIISFLLVVMMLLSMLPTAAFAADSRIVVSTVVATSSAGDITPEYGEKATNPTFTVTEGRPAHLESVDWWKKIDGSWTEMADGDTFGEGTYRYRVQIRIDEKKFDGNDGTTHVLTQTGLTLTVDGKPWEVNATVRVDDDFSYGWAFSPAFTVEASGSQGLMFYDSKSFDISTNYAGRAIQSYSVANNVEGGTAPYTFSKVSGPAWISVSSAGVISGTPAAEGENTDLVVKVSDSRGAEKTITIDVADTKTNPDNRTIISAVSARSAAGDITPEYGEKATNPTFTVTEGKPAHLESVDWWKKVDGSWTEMAAGETFGEGTYRYRVQIRIDEEKFDGNDGTTHVLAQTGLTLTVDGEAWEVNNTVRVEDDFSFGWAFSPEFTAGGNGRVIQLVENGKAPNLPGAQVSQVYFGNYKQSAAAGWSESNKVYNEDPIKWRVLENKNGKLYLFSEKNLDVVEYDKFSGQYVDPWMLWQGSTIKSWLNGLDASENRSGIDYTENNFIDAAFSDSEQNAISVTEDYKVGLLNYSELTNENYGWNWDRGNMGPAESRIGINTDYVGDNNNTSGRGKANKWWAIDPQLVKAQNTAGAVLEDGSVSYDGVEASNLRVAVRPTIHVDLNDVLFTSAAPGGKSAKLTQGDLVSVPGGIYGGAWKLTLRDSSRNSFNATFVNKQLVRPLGYVWTIRYSGAVTGENEYISALIKDSDGAVTYYGRIKEATAANGTLALTLPTGAEEGTLYVFNEQYNGDYDTDYASPLIPITESSDGTCTLTFDLNGGTPGANFISSVDVVRGQTITIPADYTSAQLKVAKAPDGMKYDGASIGNTVYKAGREHTVTINGDTTIKLLWAEINPSVSGASVSGTVTSFNDASGNITIQLIPAGFSEAAYETVAKGNTVNYSIASVDAGTYTLKVMKSNHVTREYDVTVGTDPVRMDVKIHLKGDITGDGQINIMDVNRANLHFKKKITLTGYEFDCANITGDTQVNIMDVNRMNLHFKGKSKLW